MKSLCVYCGSSPGHDPTYIEIAKKLGRYLAERKIRLVYGGAQVGIMGALAEACLTNQGYVTGIIPEFLDRIEITNTSVTELIQTKNMHERKTKMVELSDGFIAMPGGFGTLEELAEVMTWAQLGLVHKPIGILNVNGYYDHLISLFDQMHASAFVRSEHLKLYVTDASVEKLIEKMEKYDVGDHSFEQKLGLT